MKPKTNIAHYLSTLASGLFLAAGSAALFQQFAISCPPAPPILENLIKEGHYQEALDFLGKYPQGHVFISYSKFLQKAQIHRHYLHDEAAAKADLEQAIKEMKAPAYAQNYAVLSLRGEFEEELGLIEDARDDFSLALKAISAQNQDYLLEKKIDVLKRLASLEHRLGDTSAEQLHLKLVDESKKQLSNLESRVKFQRSAQMKAISSKEDLQKLLASNPFAQKEERSPNRLHSISELSPDMHVNHGYYASDSYEYSVSNLQLSESDFPTDKKVTLPGYPLLFEYPWGYLVLKENPENKKVENILLQLPDSLYARKHFSGEKYHPLSPYLNRKEIEEQCLVLERLSKHPRTGKDASIHYNLLNYYCELQEYDKALAICNSSDSMRQIQICLDSGKYEMALEFIDKVNRSYPSADNQDIRWTNALKAQALVGLKRYNEAAKVLATRVPRYEERYNYVPPELSFVRAQLAAGLNQKQNSKQIVADLKSAINGFFHQGRIRERDLAAKFLSDFEKGNANNIAATSSSAGPAIDGSNCTESSILVLSKPKDTNPKTK